MRLSPEVSWVVFLGLIVTAYLVAYVVVKRWF